MTDNNDHITTEELIHAYVSDRLKDNATDGIAASELLRLQQHAERDIYKDIRNEILRDITEDEKKKKLKEIKRTVGKERFIQLTTLLLESGLLAFLIGILVNQVDHIYLSQRIFWLDYRNLSILDRCSFCWLNSPEH